MSETEIRRMSRVREERIGQREFDDMVADFYAEDATLLPSGSTSVHGRDDIAAFWRATPENGLVALTLDAGEIEVSGDLAYEIGQFTRTLRPRHGAPFQETGKYLVVYRRLDGEDDAWRAAAEIFNSDSRL